MRSTRSDTVCWPALTGTVTFGESLPLLPGATGLSSCAMVRLFGFTRAENTGV